MTNKKKSYTKDQIAQMLGVEGYMIAAWEKQFKVTPLLKDGVPEYTHHEVASFRSIKELLYEKGFSFDAAKKYLQDGSALSGTTLTAASPLHFKQQKELLTAPLPEQKELAKKLLSIKGQLLKLRQSL